MSIVLDAVLEANRKYAETFGSKSELPIPPGRKFAIVTCMDARLDPAKFAGLAEGDAHVIRNAGGRVNEETIRSLIISHKLLGTQEWFVIHHTDCGMLTFTAGGEPGVRRAGRERLVQPRKRGRQPRRPVHQLPAHPGPGAERGG